MITADWLGVVFVVGALCYALGEHNGTHNEAEKHYYRRRSDDDDEPRGINPGSNGYD